jgi:hypothetical protein
LIVIYIICEPFYYDHAAIVAVIVVDAAIIVVAIVNPVPVAAANEKTVSVGCKSTGIKTSVEGKSEK